MSRELTRESDRSTTVMPMKSKAQRAYLHANKPGVAKEFESKTPKGKKLPKKAPKSNTKKKGY